MLSRLKDRLVTDFIIINEVLPLVIFLVVAASLGGCMAGMLGR